MHWSLVGNNLPVARRICYRLHILTLLWQIYCTHPVKTANQGAAGVDGQSIADP